MSKGSVWPVINKWIAKGNFPRLARSGRLRGYFLSMVIIVTLTCRLAVAGTLVDPWAVLATMPTGTSAIHDLTAFTDPADGDLKLVIALGFAPGAPILFWDPLKQLLSTAFTAPLNTYQGNPYWRSVLPFNGNLYAGLGNSVNNPPAGTTRTGQVWQYNGSAWTRVLNTSLYDTYTLAIYNNRLYAGLGTFGSKKGQLWVTSNGTSWTMLKQFSADYVRSLAVFQNKLYIGLRDNGGLWTYDGAKFVNIGAPPGLTLQVKTLVPSVDGTLLYVGGVPAYIYTWNGSSYTLSLNATTTDSEIYTGTVYEGDVFFPTYAKQNNLQSGNIYRLDNGTWTLEYSTPAGQAQLQVVYPFQGFIYAGGDGSPPDLLQALYQ
jgi:hypothetical protein